MGYFTPELFTFLRQLKRNNNRDWFQAHTHAYELDLKEPFLDFISDVGPRLRKTSPNLVADPRPAGGAARCSAPRRPGSPTGSRSGSGG